MELKEIRELKPGMKMAKPIFNARGVTLIPAGATLSESVIKRLNMDSDNTIEKYFYIDTPGAENVIVEDKISEQLRNETAKCIRNKQIEKLMEQAKLISKQVVDYNINSIDYYDTRNDSEYISKHSVNVAIISCIIGRSMGFNQKELYEVTLAGLLHDFSKTETIDEDVIKMYEEKLACKREELFPVLTYSLLKDTDYAKFGELPMTVLSSILYHHENENGTGYYKKNSKFLQKYKYAGILHVADTYDTLANKDMKSIEIDLPTNIKYFFYRDGITPRNIISFFTATYSSLDEKKLFDKNVVLHLLKYISVYVKGKRVELSNGDIAIVNRNFNGHPDRPEVVVIEGENKGKVLNLSSDSDCLNLVVKDYSN